MAHKITVTLQDDLDGGPADQTIRFSIGGAGYEIDLSTTNATAFREQIAPFTEPLPVSGHGDLGAARGILHRISAFGLVRTGS